ncbi:MAG: flavoprotein [Planctomycetota bacterium]
MSEARVVFAAGGVLETAFLPYRLLNLQVDYGLRLRVAASPSALEFATRTALHAVTGAEVYHQNSQFDRDGLPLHLALKDTPLLVLYPATARILAQCATGVVSCPVTRLFAFVPKERVLVAPALHPEMDLRLYRDHARRLAELGCEVLGLGAEGAAELAPTWRELSERVAARMGATRLVPRPEQVLLERLFRPQGPAE